MLSGPPLPHGDDEAGALHAATAGGKWKPAPMVGALAGSGLMEAPRTTHDTQFVEPHTGLIYTPPGASDHIAVSVLLRPDALPAGQQMRKDAATSACVYRPPTNLKAFFAPKPKLAKEDAPAPAAASGSEEAPAKRPRLDGAASE